MGNIAVKERTITKSLPQLPGIPAKLAQIYASRGIQSADELDNHLQKLIPAGMLRGIEQAVARLVQAVTSHQRIMIIGDFDADGATSSALAVSALTAMGAEQVDFIVPNRFEYGYGLTPEIVKLAAEKNPHVIITVDNGISSHDGVATANQLGIDVVVTDHHLPGDSLPDAVAIVNPNQPGCEFPSKVIAGVGVIFYVMCALRAGLRQQDWFAVTGRTEPNMAQFLDLVALGTVADVVSLDHNNRILVQQGLNRIRTGQCRVGLKALMTVAKRDARRLTASDCGFSLGPRLNAAGRLTDMSVGIQMLLSDNFGSALNMAQQLDNLNQERRRIESEMHKQALHALEKLQTEAQHNHIGYCFYHPEWHQGVIGILAGRMKEHLHRPVIAFAKVDDNTLKGSARSIAGIHIRDVLDRIAKQQPTVLSKFGGHAMAAGLSLAAADYERFRVLFDEAVAASCTPECLAQEIITDGELAAEDISMVFAQQCIDGGPWGQGFPEPCFRGQFEVMDQRIVGEKHLKLTLAVPGSQQQVDAIAFNVDTSVWPDYRADRIDCVYQLDINEFNGVQRLQLIIRHL